MAIFVGMKKWLSIFMMNFYLVMSIGVQLHLHYCCGHLSDIHLLGQEACNHHQEDSDHCCQKNECCSFVHLYLKVDDSHHPTASTAFEPFEIGAIESAVIDCCPFAPLHSSHVVAQDFSPPIERRYVLFQSLMLYA
jgi:hypothetical protein